MKLLPLEIELGFQEIGVFDILGHGQSEWTYILAKVLGESDIVMRFGYEHDPSYQHKRFGVHDNFPNSKPAWYSLNTFSKDIRQVITDAQFQADEVKKHISILPRKAEIRYPTTQ